MSKLRHLMILCFVTVIGCSDTNIQIPLAANVDKPTNVGEAPKQVSVPESTALPEVDSPNNSPNDSQTESENSDPTSCCCSEGSNGSMSRVDSCDYMIPNVELTDQFGNETNSAELFDCEGPLAVQFFFTSCSTLCPVLTSSLSTMQQGLPVEFEGVRCISISIDPQNDSPEKLKEFANSFEASIEWHFVTGEPRGIASLQKAFDAFQQNKMQHLPLTFFRASNDSKWTRINGLVSGQQLKAEFLATIKNQPK